MQIIVTTPDDSIFNVDVAEEMNLQDFFALCQHESDYLKRISIDHLLLLFNGRSYNNVKQTLKEIGLKSGDLLLIKGNNAKRSIPPPNASGSLNSANNLISSLDFSNIRPFNRSNNNPSAAGQLGGHNIKELFDQLTSDAQNLNVLRHNDPELAEAAQKKDFEKFSAIVRRRLEEHKLEIEKRRRILADPFSTEAQQMLLHDIHRQQIDEHMQIALEHTPENFGVVTMLYVKCVVNGHDVKAFVDSGAQTTIMSESCAKNCNILHLVDKRFAGIAQGVGTSKIVGRIHLGQLQIGKDFLATSFTVLENQNVELLLGLDMLRRHQCCIDLKRNKLIIGTTSGETDFLPESELPPSARRHGLDEPSSVDEDEHLSQVIADSLKTAHSDQPSASASTSPNFVFKREMLTSNSDDNENMTDCQSVSPPIDHLPNFPPFPPLSNDTFPRLLQHQPPPSTNKSQQQLNRSLLTQYMTAGSSPPNRNIKSSNSSYFAIRENLLSKLQQKRTRSQDVNNAGKLDDNNNTVTNGNIPQNVEELVQFIEGKKQESDSSKDATKVKHSSSKGKKQRKQKLFPEQERPLGNETCAIDDGYVSPDNQYQPQMTENDTEVVENSIDSPVRADVVSPPDFIDQSSSSDISQCTRGAGDDLLLGGGWGGSGGGPSNGYASSADLTALSTNDFDGDEIVLSSTAPPINNNDECFDAGRRNSNVAVVNQRAAFCNDQGPSYKQNATFCAQESKGIVRNMKTAERFTEVSMRKPRRHWVKDEYRSEENANNCNSFDGYNSNVQRPRENRNYNRDWRYDRNVYHRQRYYNNSRGSAGNVSAAYSSITTLADYLPTELPRTSSGSTQPQHSVNNSSAILHANESTTNVPSRYCNNNGPTPYLSQDRREKSPQTTSHSSLAVPASSIQSSSLPLNAGKISYANAASEKRHGSKVVQDVEQRQHQDFAPASSTTGQSSISASHLISCSISADLPVAVPASTTTYTQVSATYPEMKLPASTQAAALRRQCLLSSSGSGTAVVEFLDDKSGNFGANEEAEAAARLAASQVSFGFLDEPESPEISVDDADSTIADAKISNSVFASATRKPTVSVAADVRRSSPADAKMFDFVTSAWKKFVADSDVTYYDKTK